MWNRTHSALCVLAGAFACSGSSAQTGAPVTSNAAASTTAAGNEAAPSSAASPSAVSPSAASNGAAAKAVPNAAATVRPGASPTPPSSPNVSLYPDPPPSKRGDTASTAYGIRVEDPYRWLENEKAPEVQAWVKAQNAYSRKVLDALPTQQALRGRFAELMYLDAVAPPVERGALLFYTRRDKALEKPRLMSRPKSAGANDTSQERLLIDANTLSADGSVSLGAWYPSWDGKHLVYALHQNNADEATLYVRDVATGKDSEIDKIPGAKYAHPNWTPDNGGFYYEWLPTDAGIPIAERPGHTELRFHRLGTDPAKDPVIFPATLDPKTFLSGSLSRDGQWLSVQVQRGWQQTTVYVRDLKKNPVFVTPRPAPSAAKTGEERAAAYAAQLGFTPFVTGQDANFDVQFWNGAFYVRTNYDAPNYRVLAVKPGDYELDHWRELVPETTAKLDSMSVIGGQLVLSYLENATSRLQIHDLDGKRVRDVALPGLGSVGSLVGQPDHDQAYFSYSSFTVPNQVYATRVAGAGKPAAGSEIWSKIELPFDPGQMQVEQTWYNSKDGTRISMFVVHRAGIALDGSHPTLLYGYGGFAVDMTPAFSALITVWLEHGGVYAMPNLRGGGEYGEAWHRAGMLANKQNVFDDFSAAAEHLIASNYTRPAHLAIYGGSNGGLLVGASMVQHPELFRAVVCAVPLLDMLRYHLFGSGQTWIAEYGSAEDETGFATLYDYSPYHHVLPGVKYPALLMMAADSDDRVDPMHARKFAAEVQWANHGSGRPALFRVEEHAGHGGADLVKKRVAYNADLTAFLLDQLAKPSSNGAKKPSP